jgi:hypothetical protein
MRESRTYGSVRGALSDERPYRVSGARSSQLSAAQWSHGRLACERKSRVGPIASLA